jgi:hypothetical protein
MAGGENCNQIWHRCGEGLVGGDEEGFFALHSAAADEEGSPGRQMAAEKFDDGSRWGRREVKLEVAGDLDAGGRGTDGAEAVGVLLGLGEEERDGGQRAAPQEAEAQVARQGAIGDTRIHNGNGN